MAADVPHGIINTTDPPTTCTRTHTCTHSELIGAAKMESFGPQDYHEEVRGRLPRAWPSSFFVLRSSFLTFCVAGVGTGGRLTDRARMDYIA